MKIRRNPAPGFNTLVSDFLLANDFNLAEHLLCNKFMLKRPSKRKPEKNKQKKSIKSKKIKFNSVQGINFVFSLINQLFPGSLK